MNKRALALISVVDGIELFKYQLSIIIEMHETAVFMCQVSQVTTDKRVPLRYIIPLLVTGVRILLVFWKFISMARESHL